MDESSARQNDVCDLEGTWALRVTLGVEWASNMAMEEGAGEITQYARVHRQQGADGKTLTETIQPCGVVVPPLRRQVIGENHQFLFSSSTFQNAQERILPSQITSHYREGFLPNASFESEYAALQLGVDLVDPVTAVWPQAQRWRDVLPHAVHVDTQESLLGMPSSALKKNHFVRPQLALIPGGGRLKQAFFAVRNVERIIAQHSTCDRAEGTAEVREMEDGRHALDLALIGCTKENGDTCSEAELNNFNYYLPRMRPVAGRSSVVLIKVDDNMTCQDVSRRQLFRPAVQ